MKLYLVAIAPHDVACYELCDFRDLISGVFDSKAEANEHRRSIGAERIDMAIYELELNVPVKTEFIRSYENIKRLDDEEKE